MKALDLTTTVITRAFPLLAATALLVGGMTDSWQPNDVQIQQRDRECHASWCMPGQVDRDAAASVAEQVAELMAGRDCWTDARSVVPRTVLVHSVGSTVVREVSFAQGWDAAARGLAWVDGRCA